MMEQRVSEKMEEQQLVPGEALSNPSVQSPTVGRPDLVTFAAIMMTVVGGFQILVAISELARSNWLLSNTDARLMISYFFIWGIIGLIMGLVAPYAGFDILRGRQDARFNHGVPLRERGRHKMALLYPGVADAGDRHHCTRCPRDL
jgi:hypothetical protein